MTLILVHEAGHFLTGKILGWKLDRIYLYPYGGCSQFEILENVPLWQEGLVLIMGPLTQIVFYILLSFFISSSTYMQITFYHYAILFFNLLPIYPLDGGKLLSLVLQFFFSYRFSLQLAVWISYLLFFLLLAFALCVQPGTLFFLVLLFLLVHLLREMFQVETRCHKFCLERYLYHFRFSRCKVISNVKRMKKDTTHQILCSRGLLTEKEALEEVFNGRSKRY